MNLDEKYKSYKRLELVDERSHIPHKRLLDCHHGKQMQVLKCASGF
jgi:hypothetical protein